MKSVLLLGEGLNFNNWRPVTSILVNKNIGYEIFKDHTDIEGDFDLGILLGYSKIVPENFLNIPKNGFVLFHSSELPEGRGWAAIYNTITKGKDLVQTMLYADKKVDSGNILVKATYELKGNEIEKEVRQIDDSLTLRMINDHIDEIINQKPKGKIQDHESATWWKRRRPIDSEISIKESFDKLIDILRGLPGSAPAFFYYKGRKFYLKIEPENFLDPIDINSDKIKIDVHY